MTSLRLRPRAVVLGASVVFAVVAVSAIVITRPASPSRNENAQRAAAAAIERCRKLARNELPRPDDPQVLADCAALLKGNPLDIQSLLNQAAALEALSSSADDPTTTAGTRLPESSRSRGYAATGISSSHSSTSRPSTSTTANGSPPSTAPPCTAPTPLLCGVLP